MSQLPVLDWDAFKAECDPVAGNGRSLVSIAGVIHDVSAFVDEHPGGRTLIRSAIGKDATALFNGGVYEHSNAAHNLLSTMRVGILRGGQEVEVWKAEWERIGGGVRDGKGQVVVRPGEQVTRVGRPVSGAAAA